VQDATSRECRTVGQPRVRAPLSGGHEEGVGLAVVAAGELHRKFSSREPRATRRAVMVAPYRS
jgi:hypothetical protein